MSLLKPRRKNTRTTRSRRSAGMTTRRDRDVHQLHIKVFSPRILFTEIQKAFSKGLKLACVLGILALVCWGVKRGIEHIFVDNEEYQLKEIRLTTNGVINHSRVINIANIDLNSNLFAINVKDVRKHLNELPEVIDSSVSRELPGTLKIDITERLPIVWIQCKSLGFSKKQNGGILANKKGVTFPCQGAMWETAQHLPTIIIPSAEKDDFQHGSSMKHKDALRALSLLELFHKENIREEWMPKTISLLNNYSMEAICNNGTHALFSMYNHQRQLNDFLAICEHSSNTNRVIQRINLLPKKNIPVKFAGTPVLIKRK